jgi:hypothetical protein
MNEVIYRAMMDRVEFGFEMEASSRHTNSNVVMYSTRGTITRYNRDGLYIVLRRLILLLLEVRTTSLRYTL